jgi:DNA (cytosine-5)-methyltransferase 1
MKAFDLFSCIGGHSLGLQRAGIETIAFCELDEWRRRVIAQNFPGVTIYDDVYTAPAVEADVYVGGPPCGSTSVAAAIQGIRRGRTLWSEMLRLVSLGSPAWVVVEQPPGNSEWEDKVARSLEALGYGVRWADFKAASLGLLCPRRRRYALACRDAARLEIAWRSITSEVDARERAATQRNVGDVCVPRTLRVGDGFPSRVVGLTAVRSARVRRIRAIGDSNPPEMMAVVGRALVKASL